MAERILVIGSGAREHALAWRFGLEGAEVWCAPGNGGTESVAQNLDISVSDVASLVDAAVRNRIDLVVVGPEAPLVDGIVDALQAKGIAVFGADRAGARLEGSKVYAKRFMERHGVPTAGFRVFDVAEAAADYIREAQRPLVVKADGLASGKGVVVATTTEEALDAVDAMMRRAVFGDAGRRVVVEECLVGEELSYHIVADGKTYVALAAAQDHKRAFDGDKGPNTGGMGAYSPPSVMTPTLEAKIVERIVEPTLRGMAAEGHPYRGALFVGVMVCDGEPYTLEYNVRFGDPECEVLLMRLGGQILPMFGGAAHGGTGLLGYEPVWRAPAALCVVLAAPGYPQQPRTGQSIVGLEAAAEVEAARVFHAGTQRVDSGWKACGGRVLTVAATGEDVDEAAATAYAAVDRLHFDGAQFRRDIGWRSRRVPFNR